jgi:predicted esterase
VLVKGFVSFRGLDTLTMRGDINAPILVLHGAAEPIVPQALVDEHRQ